MGAQKVKKLKPRKLQVEYRSPKKLKPYGRNAKIHGADQVAKIAASIREVGFTNPVLVDGKNGIIAGHARVKAALELGLDKVPVIELTGLTEEKKRYLVLADNKLAELADWDLEILASELKGLSVPTAELAGFDSEELNALLEASEDLQDGVGGDRQDDHGEMGEANTAVTVGEYNVKVTRAEYFAWVKEIRKEAGFDKAGIVTEIRRRLRI